MNALEQIIEELSDDQRSLAGPLLKTKVVASRIGNEEIKNWATQELLGYRDVPELPSYRLVRPVYEWQIRQRGENQPPEPVPIMFFDEKTRQEYFRGKLDQAVKVLETLIQRGEGDSVMRKNYPSDICQYLTGKILKNDQRNITILRFRSTTDISEVVQVLSMIRAILLDFMLALEKNIPDLNKPVNEINRIGDSEQSRVTQIFHNTVITVAGHGNTIVAGDSNITSHS